MRSKATITPSQPPPRRFFDAMTTLADILKFRQPTVYSFLDAFRKMDAESHLIRHDGNVIALPSITERQQREPVSGKLRAAL